MDKIKQHIIQGHNAQQSMYEMMGQVIRDGEGRFRVEVVQDEIRFTPLTDGRSLRSAAEQYGEKLHRDAERLMDAWRTRDPHAVFTPEMLAEALERMRNNMVEPPEFLDIPPDHRFPPFHADEAHIKDSKPYTPYRDLSALENRLMWAGVDMAKPFSDCTIYRHWPRKWEYVYWEPKANKPDRQPRGKCFARMVNLGYQWSGKK